MRIGILGGSFDPPHNGHLAIAKAAQAALQLDEVLFVPARINPNKTRTPLANTHQRLEMVRLAIQGEPTFAVSDVEVLRRGPSYTIETLDALTAVMPAEYWLIMGADAVYGFDTWRRPERIIRLARIALVRRHEDDWSKIMERVPILARSVIDEVPMASVDVSSTEIRLAISSKKSVDGKLPKAVLQYIREQKLYLTY